MMIEAHNLATLQRVNTIWLLKRQKTKTKRVLIRRDNIKLYKNVYLPIVEQLSE